jgi:hypothetical protein
MHRAGAAGRDAAAEFGSGELEVLAQHPQKRRVRVSADFFAHSIDRKGDHGRPPFGGEIVVRN